MYNPQNQFPHVEENKTSSFHDMDEPIDQATKMVSSPCLNNTAYELKNQCQQIVNKENVTMRIAYLFKYPSLSKRRRLEAFVTDERKIISF